MPDTQYDLTPVERQELDELNERIARQGGLFACDEAGELLTDVAGRPVPLEYVILRGRQYLLDGAGTLWRFHGEGSSKDPGAPDKGGAPWRNNRVEMWNGRWRRLAGADGKARYAKVLVARPIDRRINGHPGQAQIDWFRSAKGYRHPHEGPHEPTSEQLAALDGGRPAAAAREARPA